MSNSVSNQEIYISDFCSCVVEKDNLSSYISKDKWECVPFETNETKGTCLVASNKSYPKPVTIKPCLTGWYKIYVCLGEIYGSNHIDIKLTNDEFPRTVSSCRMSTYTMWISTENVEESFWTCADMTNQDITISKPDIGLEYSSNIFWFRFVKMSDKEIEDFKNAKPHRHMIAHMDGDFHSCDIKNTPHDYCKAIYTMKDSDVSIICQEIMNDICDYEVPGNDFVYRDNITPRRDEYFKNLKRDRFKVYRDEIEYAHKYGIKMFAGQRMQLSNFAFPLEYPLFHIQFIDDNQDKRCIARDGTIIDYLSFGYKEVQDYIINTLLETVDHGFDGIICIWTRGVHLLFEKPVVDLFKSKFGDNIDIHVLPEDDPRLIETRSDIMTNFHKRLKESLSSYAKEKNKQEPKIFIQGCFDVQSSKKEGIDIERLAKEGLIDGVIQTKMKIYEDLDGTLTNDGLIDLEKYKEKAKTQRIIHRITGSLIDLLVSGTKEYSDISNKYGIEYYTEIQWETYKKAEEYVNGAKQIYSAYGKGISLWDCCPSRVNILSEWNAVSKLGDKEKVLKMSEEPDSYHKICKVLSYNGKDIRYYDPSWRG